MGFSTILDILGSMFIGGILLLSLFQVNNNTILSLGYYTSDFSLQAGLLDVVQIVENDLKRTGYTTDTLAIQNTKDAILEADTSSLRIVGDIDNNNILDTVRYFLGSLSELNDTRNPRDRFLYRQLNSTSALRLSTVTLFSLRYFDSFNDSLPTPLPSAETGRIMSIQVSIKVESADSYNDRYADVYWRQIRLAARNLNNR